MCFWRKKQTKTQEETIAETKKEYPSNFKYSIIFPWDEFIERFTVNCEEFSFIYNDKYINLINWTGAMPCYTYGTEKKGYENSKEYNSPQDLLENARFDGKKLEEIWDDLR